MSEMSEENLMRRIYNKEISDGSTFILRSPTTEAKDNSSSNPNVKDENNLSEKHELPKAKATPKKNLEKGEIRFSTEKHESPNYTLSNTTPDENKNIKLKQDSRLSDYFFEEPENLIDVAYQNKLIDDFKIIPSDPDLKFNEYLLEKSFDNHQNSYDILNNSFFSTFITSKKNNSKEISFQDNSNSMNIEIWKDIDNSNSILINTQKNILEPKIIDDDLLSLNYSQNFVNVSNNINGINFNQILNKQNTIPNIIHENNNITNHIMMLDEEEEEEEEEGENIDDTLAQIFDISSKNKLLKALKQREFGKQMRHDRKLQSGSKSHSNIFLTNHSNLTKCALYFEENVLSFLDKRIINLKKRIFDYALELINLIIEKNNYKLVGIDYLEVTKKISVSFNRNLLKFELCKIFSNYQERNQPLNHNRDIINYIKNNRDYESKAHYLISLKLKDFITDVFNKDENNGLKLYLEEVKKLLGEIKFTEDNEKIPEKFKGRKMKAIYAIDKTLSENIQDYFKSKKERKKKEKNMDNIDKNNKNKKKKN